jgi:hypothetical protein
LRLSLYLSPRRTKTIHCWNEMNRIDRVSQMAENLSDTEAQENQS